MLKIRLVRTGKRGQASFRIVVIESAKPQIGKTVDILGWYNPRVDGKEGLKIDKAKYQEWVEKGATPNDSVLKLVLSRKEKELKWPNKKSEKVIEAKADVKADAPVEEPVTSEKTEETPAE